MFCKQGHRHHDNGKDNDDVCNFFLILLACVLFLEAVTIMDLSLRVVFIIINTLISIINCCPETKTFFRRRIALLGHHL